jgi:hypothetical protein
MKDQWEKKLACSTKCAQCKKALSGNDLRILSVYDHTPICMACKKEEEARPDYETVSKGVIGTCMAETEQLYSDPGGYCFYHFYPFKC